MRDNSIISMLNKYGRLRKARSLRIKYKEALEAMKAYQNSELRLAGVIDNVLNRSKSVSHKCQIPGCGMIIRWEYVLQSKITTEKIIAGSTCVWVMLGLSEDQIKQFEKLETTIKDFHDMLAWRKDNMDVWDKLMKLKEANIEWFKPFWTEVEYCRLHPEDEKFIRSIDVDDEIRRESNMSTRRRVRRSSYNSSPKTSKPANNAPVQRKPVFSVVTPKVANNAFAQVLNNIAGSVGSSVPKSNSNVAVVTKPKVTIATDYQKLVAILDVLVKKYPQNTTLLSIKTQADSGKTLTENQLHRIKIEINNDYFETHIKGTPDEAEYNSCDSEVTSLFKTLVEGQQVKIYFMDMDMLQDSVKIVNAISKYRRQFHEAIEKSGDHRIKELWKYFRIKHHIIMK